MAKKNRIKYEMPLLTYPNLYSWGGDLLEALKLEKGAFNLKDTFSGANVGSMLKGGAASLIGGTVGKIGGGLIGGELESGAGSAISNVGSAAGSIIGAVNPILGGAVTAASGIIGGLTNRMFGSKLNKLNINNILLVNSGLNNLLVDSSSNDSIMSQYNNQSFGLNFSRGDIGKDGWFSNKASNKYNRLLAETSMAKQRGLAAYDNAIGNADTQLDFNILSTTGNYTNNAAFGGLLTHGGYFNNGITTIETGGTHGLNPFGGVLVGVDPEGTPNTVEEGELIWNDFVFSNRIKVPNELRKNLKLGMNKDITFAGAAKKALKESEERPNDIISKNGLDAMLNRLAIALENIKGKQSDSNEHGNGGKVNRYAFGITTTSLSKGESYKKLSIDWSKILGNNSQVMNLPVMKLPEVKNSPIQVPLSLESLGINIYPAKLQVKKKLVKSSIPKTDISPAKIPDTPPAWMNPTPIPAILALREARESLSTSKTSITPDKISIPKDQSNTNSNINNLPTDMRYAPIVGAAIGLGQSLFSKPDYSNADMILDAAKEAGKYTPVEYTPLGDYMGYKAFDRNFYLNKLNALAASTRNAFLNSSNPNKAANILAADYNALGRMGDLARLAEEYNLAQRLRVAEFNRGTNLTNSLMALQASLANAEMASKARNASLSGIALAAAMRDAIDTRRGLSISANLTNLFNNMGAIGNENFIINLANNNRAFKYSTNTDGSSDYKVNSRAKGGKIRKRNKGLKISI